MMPYLAAFGRRQYPSNQLQIRIPYSPDITKRGHSLPHLVKASPVFPSAVIGSWGVEDENGRIQFT